MLNNQILDDGAVIGYRPDLNYTKDIDNKSDTSLSTDKNDVLHEYHTVALAYLMSNMPSDALNNIGFSKQTLWEQIEKLTDAFIPRGWEKYNNINALISAINNKNDQFIKSFVDYHSHNINGSIVPELVYSIYKSYDRLERLESTIKEVFYGDGSLSIEQSEEFDLVLKKKLMTLENEGMIHKLDYASISLDASVNRLISAYTFSINGDCIKLANVIDEEIPHIPEQTSTYFIEKMYNKINEALDSRHDNFDEYQNVETMSKTLYNYYSVRNDIHGFYTMMGDTHNSYIGQKIEEYQKKVDESIEEIAKSFLGNIRYIRNLASKEREKYYMMETYQQLSAVFE